MCFGVPEVNVRALMLELKTLTNPVSFGIGLGFPDHEMELLKKDNPLGKGNPF